MRSKVKLEIGRLRLLAKNQSILEKQAFYRPYFNELSDFFESKTIKELSQMIQKEKDSYLQELECEALSKQLSKYVGPITFEYLDFMLGIFPISSVWRLAASAEFPLIQEKARIRLDQILDQYGIENKDAKEKRK